MSAQSELVCDAIVGSYARRDTDSLLGKFVLQPASRTQLASPPDTSLREGMLSLGAGGEVLSADDSAVRLLGYSRWSLLALRANHLFDANSFQRLQTCREGRATAIGSWGTRKLASMMVRRADGTCFESEVNLLTCVERGPGTEMLLVIREMGEAPGDRRAVARLDEKALYGEICCELVHDLNNMLEVVMGNMQLASNRISDVKSREFLATAENACWHGARLVRSILQGARGATMESEEVALGAMLSELWPLIEASVGRHIRTSMLIGEGDLRVCVDRTALKAAILNLVVNAKHAIASVRKGQIHVEVGAIAEQSVGNLSKSPGHAVIYVVDDGPGIPSPVLKRLFEPFFTTDRSGKGSGLGLSMVKRFAESHGGRVVVKSVPGQGTRVGIVLPALPASF